MGRIVWDDRGKRVVENGVSKVVLYPKGKDGVAWNGLTGITERSSGAENTDLYADNQKYCSFRSAESYEGTIEAYTYPDEFAECDGSRELTPGVRIIQQTRLPFDFCYRTEIFNSDGNSKLDRYKLHLIYNAVASPSEKAYESINDSPDAITFSWEIKTIPFMLDGHRASSTITIDTSKADRIAVERIEEILYGMNNVSPRMPDPEEVLQLLKRLDIQRFLMNYIVKRGLWIWDTFNFNEDTVLLAIDREAERRVIFEPKSDMTYTTPSIAYTLIEEQDNGRKKYLIIIIDDNDTSQIANEISENSNVYYIETVHSNDLYYYCYHLYA